MTKDRDQRIHQEWEKRWKGSEEHERLTFIGRRMFKAKKRALAALLSELDVAEVIEVGCGLGHTLQVYHNMGLKARGIDVSPSAVAACRKKGLDVELGALEDETGTYDLVSSDGMLEHFLNFEPIAHHLMRISTRFVLIIQPNHGSFWGRTMVYLAELIRGDENVREYNYLIRDFVDVFESRGFILEKSVPIFADVFRILLFRKAAFGTQAGDNSRGSGSCDPTNGFDG
ncbi:MAG: class I SAM-dependent methyltransferase [Pseudomonadota bacterium]